MWLHFLSTIESIFLVLKSIDGLGPGSTSHRGRGLAGSWLSCVRVTSCKPPRLNFIRYPANSSMTWSCQDCALTDIPHQLLLVLKDLHPTSTPQLAGCSPAWFLHSPAADCAPRRSTLPEQTWHRSLTQPNAVGRTRGNNDGLVMWKTGTAQAAMALDAYSWPCASGMPTITSHLTPAFCLQSP